MSSDPVLLDIEDGIGHVRLNRPDVANALDLSLLKALLEAVMRCHGDPSLRAVLLTGEGRNFCGGGDVRTFAAQGEDLPDYLRTVTAYLQMAASALMQLQAPVVTLVQGHATGGGGFGLVCASDLVLAGASARFMLGATRVGMAPDAGVSVTLQRIVGLRRAMDIAINNPMLDASTALELGLVTSVVDDDDLEREGRALARGLADGPTRAYAETKRLLWNGTGSSVQACLADEARTVAQLSGTEDAREGLAAVIERRSASYVGR
jgi:2-(1,2-epoxy-1,2-dihydrophenyl)acetyl-CoA isomerase